MVFYETHISSFSKAYRHSILCVTICYMCLVTNFVVALKQTLKHNYTNHVREIKSAVSAASDAKNLSLG